MTCSWSGHEIEGSYETFEHALGPIEHVCQTHLKVYKTAIERMRK